MLQYYRISVLNRCAVCVCPQFVQPHSRGSSHGQTRIIRKAYEQDFYTHMMEESFQLWTQLEKEAGVMLYRYVCACVCQCIRYI